MPKSRIEDKEPKIRQYYKPSDREKDLLAHAYDRYYNMKDSTDRSDAEKEWDNAEKAWDQYSEEDESLEEWQSKIYIPQTTAIVESLLSEMVDQAPRPIILPRAPEDKAKATVMRHVFEYTWDVADGDLELENVLKDCLIYGMGFAQEFYWKDRRLIQKLSGKKESKGLPPYEEQEVFDFDDSYMESISPYEVFFDPTARTINRGPKKARDAVRRYVMKLADAKIFFSGDVWDPLGNMRYVRPGGDTDWYSFYKPPEDVDKADEVEVLWYWSRSPEDWLLIVCNDVLIKAGPNPYKHKQLPFAVATDVRRPHKFYHKGEPKLVEAIQKEVNTIRRMIIDRNHLDIDKMWLVSRAETMDEDDTIARPHGMIRVDDPANYKPIDYGDIPNSVKFSLDELNKDGVRVTGVEERFQAVKTPGTATEAAILKESTMRRVRSKLRRLENEFLVDIGRMRVANILQFYSQPKMERIVGEARTEEYRNQIREAQRKGLLQVQNGKPYRAKYRDIRLKNKELTFDETGQVTEKPTVGFSFFELRPEFFLPVARGGYDIRFEAGSTMPVSKSLMAKQTQDAVAQLMPLALQGIGYDPVKLGDQLLRSLDQEPDDYRIEEVEKTMQEGMEAQQIDLAAQENDEVTKGNPILPTGTPYASIAHTSVHVAYSKSNQAQAMDPQQFKLLAMHTMGELAAQDQRGKMGGMEQGAMPGQAPQAGGAPSVPYNQELKAAMPGMVQGGEEVQGSIKGSEATSALGLMGRKR